MASSETGCLSGDGWARTEAAGNLAWLIGVAETRVVEVAVFVRMVSLAYF
jgi:hypothetical protein